MVPSRAFPLSLSLSLFSTPTHASSSNERNETRGAQQICVIMFAKAFPKAKKKKTKKTKNEEKRASKGEDISLSVLIGGDFY